MLHDPLAERRRRLVEGNGVDPSLRSEMGQGDHDPDPQVVGKPRRRPVAGDGKEGDVEIAVGPRCAPGAGTEDHERGDSRNLPDGLTDTLQVSVVHVSILADSLDGSPTPPRRRCRSSGTLDIHTVETGR